MNRLQFAISQAQTMSVSVRASESRIRDANIAEEAASLTKFNILTQSGLSALSQANQSSQSERWGSSKSPSVRLIRARPGSSTRIRIPHFFAAGL